MLTSCPQYTELYTAWKDAVQEMKNVRDLYVQEPSEKLLADFEKKKENILEKKKDFLDAILFPTYFTNRFISATFPKIETDILHELEKRGYCPDSLEAIEDDPEVIAELALKYPTQDIDIPLLEKYLKCLTSLKSITYDGAFTHLPSSPTWVDSVSCFGCAILTLPPFPPLIQKIILNDCIQLKVIPPIPNTVTSFSCEGCSSLETLPPLPQNLERLKLSKCPNLTTLPLLPENLEFIVHKENESEEIIRILKEYQKTHRSCQITPHV